MPSVGELWMSLEIKAGEFTEEPLTLHLYLHLRSESCKLRWAEMEVVPDRKLQRVESSVFVFQTLPETLQRPQAAPSRPAQLQTRNRPTDGVCQAWSVIWCDGGRTFLPLAPWELNPRLILRFSPLPVRDRIQNKNIALFLAARLWRGGEEEREGCRGQTPTHNTTKDEEEDDFFFKEFSHQRSDLCICTFPITWNLD